MLPELNGARDRAEILVWESKGLYERNSPELERLQELYERTFKRFTELITEASSKEVETGRVSELYDNAYNAFQYFEEFAIKILDERAGPSERSSIPTEPLVSVNFELLVKHGAVATLSRAWKDEFVKQHSWNSWSNIAVKQRTQPLN